MNTKIISSGNRECPDVGQLMRPQWRRVWAGREENLVTAALNVNNLNSQAKMT